MKNIIELIVNYIQFLYLKKNREQTNLMKIMY